MNAQYRDFLWKWPGEHYRWLTSYVRTVKPGGVLEIGRGLGSGSIALFHSLPREGTLWSYDTKADAGIWIPDWMHQDDRYVMVHGDACDSSAYEGVLDVGELDFALLDVDPHDGKQESRALSVLKEGGFEGVVLCDDIRANDGMKEWWASVEFTKLDITDYGHASGSGLVALAV